MRIDEAPVSAALRRRTLEAARAMRRRRLSIFGAAATMGLATAAVACVLLLPGLWHAAGLGPGGTGDAGTAAPDSMQTAEATGAPQAVGQPLPCVAIPLRAASGGAPWEGVGYDGAFSVSIEPGKLDDTLGQYHLIEDGHDSTAAEKLAALRGSQNELRLVLATNPSCTPRLNAVGLTLAQGGARFLFTDCTDGEPRLYSSLDEAIGNYGFLVEVPPEAAGLPFASASVPWGEVGSRDKIAIMLERILTNAEAEAYLSTAKFSREAATRIYLEKSPMETAGILSMGQLAVDWLTARRDALQQSGGGLPFESDVVALLIGYMGGTTPSPDTETGAPADSTPEGTLRRDLDMHILEDGGAPAGDGVRQYYYLLPLYQKDEGRIVAAVLASVQRGDGEQPGEPRLFLVDARYRMDGSEWKRENWDITPDARPGIDDYDALRYRGWDSQLYAMYAELNTQLSGLVDKPFSPRLDNVGGQTVKLTGATGTLRWYRLSKWVVLEKGAGSNNIDVDVKGFPEAGSIAGDLAPLSDGKWKKVSEKDYEKANATPDKAGFAGAWLELNVAADEGLWYYSFRFNYDKENVTLWRWLLTADGRGQTTECYVSTDSALYGKMMAALRVSTDVSDLLIDSAPGPKLPQDREELKYLVAYVQDMPGGIAEIKPAILYGDGSGGLTEEKLTGPKGKQQIVAWAEALGALLSGDEWAVQQIDGLPATMAAQVEKGRPAMLRWDVVPAAMEGKASLTIWANPVTHQVWSKTVYRLYGTTDIHTWYTASAGGDERLYLLLTKLTFGREISDPGDLPQ